MQTDRMRAGTRPIAVQQTERAALQRGGVAAGGFEIPSTGRDAAAQAAALDLHHISVEFYYIGLPAIQRIDT
jgi:hypothetical protein